MDGAFLYLQGVQIWNLKFKVIFNDHLSVIKQMFLTCTMTNEVLFGRHIKNTEPIVFIVTKL